MTSSLSTLYHSSPAIWWKVAVNLKKHTDLLQSLGNLAVNTCEVAVRAFEQVPRFLGKLCNVYWSFGGIIAIPGYWKEIGKNCRDSFFAFEGKEFKSMVMTAIKTAVKVTDMLLCCGTVVAALSLCFNYPIIALYLYSGMISTGLASIVAGIVFEFFDYYEKGQILKKLSDIENSREKIQGIASHIIHTLSMKEAQGAFERPFALQIIRQLNAYTVDHLQEKISQWKGSFKSAEISSEVLNILKRDIQQAKNFKSEEFGLVAFGYLCMAISRANPATLLQSCAHWIVCFLWTGKTAIEKYRLEETNDKLDQCGK